MKRGNCSFCEKLNFRPRELKMNVENESNTHKIRIVGFSVLMAAIAGAY
jgi:hypothetical protein